MNYKLIAFDMDGTLLNSAKQITYASVNAYTKAVAAGKLVCLSTGRGIAELKEYTKQLAPMQYYICYSGAAIWDNQAQTAICTHSIPAEDVLKIFAICQKYDAMPQLLSSQSLVQGNQACNLAHYHMGIYQSLYNNVATFVPNIKQYYLKHMDMPVLKFNIYFADPVDRDEAQAQLSQIDITLAYAEESAIECSLNGISKGTGLKELCSYLHLPLDSTIAVGDSYNDLEILQTAGLAVVMANGNENVKAIADVIVKNNDQGGCAQAIEEYLLKEKNY